MDSIESILGAESVAGTLLQSTTVLISAIDPAGRVLLWNRGAETILGWREDEVLGRELPAIFPEHRAQFESMRRRILAGEALEGYRMRHRCKDGSSVELILSLRAVTGKNGTPRAILGLGSLASDEDEAASRRRTSQMRALELELLGRRLPTHFLLNALHDLGMVVRKQDSATAVRMVAELGDMLRHVLRSDPGDEVSLGEELAFVERYVSVDGLRRRRAVPFEIRAGRAALEARVPALVLQPLVENALRHGLAARNGRGWLRIRAERRAGRLLLRVEDNGRGLPAGWTEGEGKGLGLAIVRARLARSFGADHRLLVSDRAGGGVTVALDMPYRPPA